MRKRILLAICSLVIAAGGIGMASLPHQEQPVSSALLEEAQAEEEPEVIVEEVIEEPEEEMEEAEDIEVVLKSTSMERDLKVKFVDKNTGKVISGADFKMELTNPSKVTKEYSDHDQDGIIWVTDIDGGNYTVKMLDLEGYITAKSLTAEVRKKIVYQVVEIEEEVKKESEIVVSKEDAAYGGTAKDESTSSSKVPTDTVEYVESTKTEVAKNTAQKTDSFGQLMYEKQKTDSFGQLVYKLQKTDELGNPMYAKILSESANYHVDADSNNLCDRCGAGIAAAEPETPKGPEVPESPKHSQNHEFVDENGDENCDICNPPVVQTVEKEDGVIGMSFRPFSFLRASSSEKYINYDTASAPVYDTTSAPVYDTTSAPVYDTEITYMYTGWQTIDGATYYFDKNGNKVTGQQVIEGISYTFSSEGVRSGTIGIDVSKYQTGINWTKVKNAGINFVMIRCGYRGYGSGVLVEDSMFRSHISGAKGAGLRVGVYFFSQAINEAEAVEEASMAVALAKKYGINMPIAIDSEYAAGGSGRADGLSKSERTTITKAFCNTVKNAGYTPMVYASKSWFSTHLDVSQLSGYRIWVAHYAEKCGYTGNYHIWQNTDKGKVDGVPGYVDMNISSI